MINRGPGIKLADLRPDKKKGTQNKVSTLYLIQIQF